MKRFLLLFSFSFSLYPVFAQKVNIDSLLQVVILREHHTKITISPNRDSLLKLFPLTKSTAARVKLIYDIIYNYGNLSPRQSIYYKNKLLDLTRKENDPLGEAIVLSELGITYFQNGDIIKGLNMNFIALTLAEKTGNKRALGIIYNNLGFCYPDDINLSKAYYQKAVKFSQEGGDDLFTSFELSNLSAKCQELHKADSSWNYLMKSFELSVRKNIEQAIPHNLIDIADMQTDAKLKLKYYRAALNMPFTRKDSSTLCRTLQSLASYYKEQDMIDSSLFYAKKAYNAANGLLLIRKVKPAKLLANIYRDRNANSALKYTNIYYVSRDSMNNIDKMRQVLYLAFTDQQHRQKLEAQKTAYQTKLQFYILLLFIAFLILVAFVFWRNTRSKHRANLLLQRQKEQIQDTLKELKLTQQQLVQSEKMASLGELTAGVAHEIQNPLNFVNNFSEVSMEMLDEMELELNKGDAAEAKAIAADVKQNLEKIRHHGKRADSIVKGMLQHSRIGSSLREPTDLNKLADEYLRLAYHGLRAKDKTFDAEMKTEFDNKLPLISIVTQDIGRALLNLITNSFYALQQKRKIGRDDYKPTIKVSTALKSGFAEIIIWDNGIGIPANIKDKIMQPFFTTKPSGQGTGLGLSLSYDIIVKEHNGKITVDTMEGEYTAFIISIPL